MEVFVYKNRSFLVATVIAFGVAEYGKVSAATFDLGGNSDSTFQKGEKKKPIHEFLGTVKSLIGNVLTIILDEDDAIGAKKGTAVSVRIAATTRVRTGDRLQPGAQVFVAASLSDSTWDALDVRERRPAPVAEEHNPVHPGPGQDGGTIDALRLPQKPVIGDSCTDCFMVRVQSTNKFGSPVLNAVKKSGDLFYLGFYAYIDATKHNMHVSFQCDIIVQGRPDIHDKDACTLGENVPLGFKGVRYLAAEFEERGTLLAEPARRTVKGRAVISIVETMKNARVLMQVGSATAETSFQDDNILANDEGWKKLFEKKK